jgi:hypothetical protein
VLLVNPYMELIATVFGWSQGTWTVVVSLLALVVALGGLVVAIGSHRTSRRAVEETARSASAAERSAGAAEDSAQLQREGVEIERMRERRERLQAVKERGPEWEATEEGEAGYFLSDGERMRGGLRNVGLTTAAVQGAYIDFDGQRAAVRTRCDGPHGGGGWASKVYVPPQAVLELDCGLGGIRLQGNARPSLYMDYEQLGADVGLLGVTFELLRTGNTAAGKDAWRVGRIREGLLP